jgi:hypothetical protein
MAQKKKKAVSKPKGKGAKGTKKVSPQAVGFRNAIAKAFPTFAKALAVKPVDGQGNSVKKIKPVVPMTPSINLLPVEYTIGRTISNVRRGTAIAGTGIAAALSVVFLAQGAVIGIAEQAQITVQAQVNEANLKVETYRDTSELYVTLNERKSILDNIEKGRPAYYAAINELYAKLPAGTIITGISMEHISLVTKGSPGGPVTGTVCGPIADPFASETRPVSACVKFQGTMASRADLSAYATALAESGIFSNVVVGRSTEQFSDNSTRVPFSGTAAVLRDIDPGTILESQPSTGGESPAPLNPSEPGLEAPSEEGIPAGVFLDPINGAYYTADRAYQYLPDSKNYVQIETGDVYASSPIDGSIDLAGGAIGRVSGNQEGSGN